MPCVRVETHAVAVYVDPKEPRLLLRDREFRYSTPAPDTLVLEGRLQGHAVRVRMRLLKPDEFQLINRGFHWITEYPFNR